MDWDQSRVRKGISFGKISRNRLGIVSVIPRKNMFIPRPTEESVPKLETERNGIPRKKFVLQNSKKMI